MRKLLLLLSLSMMGSTAMAGLMCPAKNPGCGIQNKTEVKAVATSLTR